MSNKSTWEELKEISKRLIEIRQEILDEIKRPLEKILDKLNKKGASND